MQAYRDPSLSLRFRYVQSVMDISLLQKGDSFDVLPTSYVIFLCTFDPYGCDLPIYTFSRSCIEEPRLHGVDKSSWIILNASAWQHSDDERLRSLLQYIQEGHIGDDPLAKKLDAAVDAINEDEEKRQIMNGFITLEMDQKVRLNQALQEGIAMGKAEGLAEGSACFDRFTKLTSLLIESERPEDLKRAAEDEAFREALYRECVL